MTHDKQDLTSATKQNGRVELCVAERQSLRISARHECPDVGIAGDLLRVVPHSSPKSELNLSSLFIYKGARKDKHVFDMHVWYQPQNKMICARHTT